MRLTLTRWQFIKFIPWWKIHCFCHVWSACTDIFVQNCVANIDKYTTYFFRVFVYGRKLLSFKMINHICCSQNSPPFHRTICHVAEYHLCLWYHAVCVHERFSFQLDHVDWVILQQICWVFFQHFLQISSTTDNIWGNLVRTFNLLVLAMLMGFQLFASE